MARHSIRLATYNIHKSIGLDRRRDPERIMAVLREVDADIIAIQEIDRRFGVRATTLPRSLLDHSPWQPLPLSERPRSLGWHGNTILMRKDFRTVHAERVALPTLEPRGAVSATIECEGQQLCVIGAHLDLSGIRRKAQMRTLRECMRASGMPAILMGDFNQWGLRRGAVGVFDESFQICAPGPSFPANRPIARLDRMVATQGATVIAAEVHHSALAHAASDHLPVWADVELPKK